MLKTTIIQILLHVSPDPIQASYIAALEAGRLDIVPSLIAVCQRESRCQPLGVHEIDAHLSRRGWKSQVRMGHLDPECQPYIPAGWATRGAFGLSAASHWEYLPECYEPAMLDSSLVSARVATAKYLKRCDKRSKRRKKNGWCPSQSGIKAAGGIDPDMTRWAFNFLVYHSGNPPLS